MESHKLNRLKSLLSELDTQNIAYVSWKNNHQLPSVMSGNGDLDLLVPNDSKDKFIEVCKVKGWIETINPVAKFPHIKHFYRLGENNEIYHIHVYFKLITGETWLKEFYLPFDIWLLENRVWNSNLEVWVANDEAQAYLFLVRHLLKCGSISSRLLYNHEFASYHEEWKVISKNIKLKDIQGPIDITSYIKGARCYEENIKLPKISSSILFRLSFLPFLRFKLISLPFRRFFSFFHRLINKGILKHKKMLPERGLILAISGVDGSGKTTMLEEVHEILGKFLTIERFHLGKPQGKFIEFIWRILGNKSKNSSMAGTSNILTPSSKAKAINGAILSLLRLGKAWNIVNRSRKGSLMLIDRWPTDEVGKMDGPRVILGDNISWIVNTCKRIEDWSYASMPKADICYFFKVPIEVARQRNKSRVKENKETDEMISARFLGNLGYKPLAKKTINFENAGEFSVKRKELLENIWNEISNRY